MTRKDYERIAAALRITMGKTMNAESFADRAAMQTAVRRAASDVADALGDENSRFDRARFLTACGVTP